MSFKVKITEIKLGPTLQGRPHGGYPGPGCTRHDGEKSHGLGKHGLGREPRRRGKDDVTALYVNRPFEVDWPPGDQIVVEVWDRKGIFSTAGS